MKQIVITGSTRGIGYALADAFLANGCRIIVNGRDHERVEQACVDLAIQYGSESLYGFPASVSDPQEMENLWTYAVENLGAVDIWINNAGLAHETKPPWELAAGEVKNVIDVNVLGLIFGSQVAMRGMLKQGFGQIYNMEGFGSKGRMREGMSIYGTSKAAVHYFTQALINEAEETGIVVGALSPGMVMTDMVLDRLKDDPEELEKAKSIFNIIADTVDNVAPWMVEQILANDKNGASIDYMTRSRMVGRFLKSPFSKRDLFAGEEEEEEDAQDE
jgi:NAD(P)-dependent dehydrogenase (short-subunit alcohol dehydrogenase family)